MVFSRIASINGKTAEEMLDEEGIAESKKRFLSRETNLSYKWELNETETIVEGEFWTKDTEDINQLSLDENFAKNIGVKMGDTMVFDIQGVEIEAKVTSIRSVKWQNMRPNFFVVMPPSLLEGAPLSFVMSASLKSAQAKQDFQEYTYSNHPSVMNIDISEVAKRIQGVLKDIVQLTQFFLYFIMAIALFVILNACLETRKFRVKDIALLRTLGAGSGTLSLSWIGEFFLMGFTSSTLGVLVSIGVTSYLANVLLSLSVTPSLQVSGILIGLVCVVLTVVGIASTIDLLFKKPFGVLKSSE